ncbi:MAG TPA: glycosyltransferase family 2 protein [Blastocatellia bacterium]|nr:glycosyltransferase family 2 protein [Blastocatellia bacterium]
MKTEGELHSNGLGKPRFGKRLREALGLSVRLGVLSQYPPRPLKLPRHYARRPSLVLFPCISIITPSFNQGRFIERTIRSVLDQDYPNLEYIIQDGGSADETTEILKRHQVAFAHWESRADEGQAHAINLGFRHSTGELMAWLNSDDLLLPGALHYVAGYFNRHPEIDAVYGHRVLIDEDDAEIGRWVMPPHDDEIMSWAAFIPQETLFWRRRLWEKAGGALDQSFQFAMDWDLLLRFRDAGAKFARLPRFLGAFRVHPQQKSSSVIDEIGVQEMNRLRLRALGRAITAEELGRRARPYIIRHIVHHKLNQLLEAFNR